MIEPAQIAQLSPGPKEHPRTIGWIGTTALAMGGSNQSLFLLSALFIGQESISGQGSAAVPLLVVGLLLAWAAAPGWTELVLMWGNFAGNMDIVHWGGWLGIITALVAWYTSAADVITGMRGRPYLPVGAPLWSESPAMTTAPASTVRR